MRKYSTIIPAVILLAAVSCSKEVISQPEVKDVKGVKAVITATAPQTKTEIGEGGAYSWVAGDEISVFTTTGDQCWSSFVAQSDGNSTEFVGEKYSASDILAYAVYPYDMYAGASSEGVVSTYIPTSQDGTIASAISVGTAVAEDDFAFVNASSAIKMTVDSKDAIRYIRIEFAKPVTGNVNVDCTTGEITDATEKSVSISSYVALDGDIYFNIAPVAAGKITIYFRNMKGDTAIKTATVTKDFSAGTVKNLGTVSGLTFMPGALPGIFTTQEGKRYVFSKGVLKYQASTGTFAFTDNQFSCVGKKAGNTTTSAATRETQEDWVDMFCWGTSGYDYGATKWQPWSIWDATGTSCGNGAANLTGNMDWGYNKISNGGDVEGFWVTPSVADFNYLKGTVGGRMGKTDGANNTTQYCKATIAGMKGVVFFPDVWTCPDTVWGPDESSFNNPSEVWTTNTWTAMEWADLEDSGAVFFPCCGWVGTGGGMNLWPDSVQFKYWSKTHVSDNLKQAYLMSYSNGSFLSNDVGTRSSQAAVRLIHMLD